MRHQIYSYRYAQEILEHANNRAAWDEIIAAVDGAPLFTYAGKSKNLKLDVVQQVLNTWFDRELAVDRGWLYHPLATSIAGSGLAADFRKRFNDRITVQAEVQFGNMSRWYSDVFKFQTAYSQGLIDIGLCIVPMASLARRIDSNVVSFERILRELPSARMSLTLPILVIGLEPDEQTTVIDLRKVKGLPLSQLTKAASKNGGGRSEHNRYRLVHALSRGRTAQRVTAKSPTGPMPKAIAVQQPVDNDD